jgi:hypothetical protein
MNPLKPLDDLVTEAFESIKRSPETVHPPTFCSLLIQASTEASHVRALLLEHAFVHKDQNERKVFIEAYQAVCVHLINVVFEGGSAIAALPYNQPSIVSMERMRERIQENLLDILAFIQAYFYKSFDAGQVMPVPFAVAESKKLYDQFLGFLPLLKAKTPESCVEILLAPMKVFYEEQERNTSTFSALRQFSDYAELVRLVVHASNDGAMETLLMQGFIQISYSPPRFTTHFVDSIASQAKRFGTTQKSLQYLQQEYQVVLQAQAKNKLALRLKQDVLRAIEHQISLYTTPALPEEKSAHSVMKPQQLLHTPLSVAQLALLLRIMVDAGAIECTNQTLLLKIIANSFTSKRAAVISPASLRVKYYDTDPASVQIVKGYVIRMMNNLQRI